MTKCLLPFLLLFVMADAYAQLNYNQQDNFLKANSVWTVTHNQIDFNTHPPTASKNDSSSISEGCASVADPLTGALLFYSNGSVCRDRNNAIMPNGDSLFGNGGYVPTGGSSLQGVCIVPVINSPGRYYHFSMRGGTDRSFPTFPGEGGLCYSIVDMNLNGGLGDVERAHKNIILNKDSFLFEGMIAVPGNDCDIWLITHSAKEPVFMAYHITAEGINTTPIISKTGNQIRDFDLLGALKVSPDRKKIALNAMRIYCLDGYMDSASGTLLSNFDPATGTLSETVEIGREMLSPCVEFSPDNSKLYLADFDYNNDKNYLYQYDITKHDASAINASRKLISRVFARHILFKLYNDTIYLTDADSLGRLDVLSSINQPNLSGLACNYQFATIPLAQKIKGPPINIFAALPNDVVYPFKTHQYTPSDTICTAADHIVLRPSGTLVNSRYLWNNGKSDSTLTVQEEGVYWVAYENDCTLKVDTFTVASLDFQQPVIRVDVFQLSTTFSYNSYQWLFNGSIIPGATDSAYQVEKNGFYRVIVRSGPCIDTSAAYEVTNTNHIASSQDIAQQISLFPNPFFQTLQLNTPIPVVLSIYSIDGRLVMQTEGTEKIAVSKLSAGAYFIHIYSKDGRLLKVEQLVKMNTQAQ